jgi:hypothetical protein
VDRPGRLGADVRISGLEPFAGAGTSPTSVFEWRVRDTGTKVPTDDRPSGDSAQDRLLHLLGRYTMSRGADRTERRPPWLVTADPST